MLSKNLPSCFTVPLSRSLDSDESGSAIIVADSTLPDNTLETGSVSMDLEDDESMVSTGDSLEMVGGLA